MKHELPRGGWTMPLANAIEIASNDDVIVCHSAEMVELAKRAHARMCPDKTLTFEIETDN